MSDSVTSDFKALREIRLSELNSALALFPKSGRVLELGAGTGYQAQELANRGYAVMALDVQPYDDTTLKAEELRVFPVATYDGQIIPHSDATFDVVFSSNLLEHIREPTPLLHECVRVLAAGGRIVTIVPTTTWRWWSLVAHYVRQTGSVLLWAVGAPGARPRKWGVRYALFPPRHGELGNAATELVTYSRWWWRRVLRQAGLVVVDERSLGVSASGEYLSKLTIRQREAVARLAGSSCRAFLAHPSTDPL